MKKTTTSRIIAWIASLAVSISIFGIVMIDAQATETSVVKYQKVTSYEDFLDCIVNEEAPECEDSGYLFAGWYYYKDGEVGKPIYDSSEITDKSTEIAAKFVAARLTGIACQIRADATLDNVTSTKLRIVSTVDSGNYSKVGFNVYGRRQNADGTYKNWVMYEHNDAEGYVAESDKVYSGLYVYECDENGELQQTGEIKYPKDVFGADAEGFKFTTMSLSSIARANYSTIVAIKPYWITLDGTYVEGVGEYNRVQDGIDDIVNISVNLQTASNIAAGRLNVTYNASNFDYVGAEYGRVFEEMQFEAPVVVNNIGTIKCVGHVANVSENVENPNDIFVNLRFKKTPSNKLNRGEALFEIVLPESETDVWFCDRKEKPVTDVEVWDVYY